MKMPTRCPKCEGAMSEGFVLDEGYGTSKVSTWQAGEPRKSFWMGVKQSRQDQLPVSTWRCDRCFYLESYALSG